MRLLLGSVLFAALLFAATQPAQADPTPAFPPVGMDGDWLTVGGEKFLVVGVGYEAGTRPGRIPLQRDFRPDLLRADFQRIRDAGFNTLRTWAPLTDDELQLAAEHGLWVIQGIWFDAGADFGNPAFQQETLKRMADEVARSAKHPNILFYLLGNEPHADAVHASGPDVVNAFYRKMVHDTRRHDPKRFFSYANCVITDFMVPDMFDLTAQNVYPYAPGTIEKTLGYRGYLRQIKKKLAPDKPLIVTEFGLSVSPTGDGRGYGGNTLDEQRDGVIAMWDDLLAAGAGGGCAFMWTDGWWKHKDENTHDDHAEEWYGFLATDEEFVGKPRPVYFALQDYQRAIRTLPRDGAVCAGVLPVEVWSPTAGRVQARVDDGGWVELTQQGPWWRADMDLSAVPEGAHVLHTRMRNASGAWASKKQATIRVRRAADAGRDRLSVEFVELPQTWRAGEALPVTVRVRGPKGNPVAGRRVNISRFCHTAWNEYDTSVLTDVNGVAAATLPAFPQPGILSVAAAAEGDLPERNTTGWKQGPFRRYGDYRHVELVE